MLTDRCKDVWAIHNCNLQQMVKFGELAKCTGSIDNTLMCVCHIYDGVRS